MDRCQTETRRLSQTEMRRDRSMLDDRFPGAEAHPDAGRRCVRKRLDGPNGVPESLIPNFRSLPKILHRLHQNQDFPGEKDRRPQKSPVFPPPSIPHRVLHLVSGRRCRERCRVEAPVGGKLRKSRRPSLSPQRQERQPWSRCRVAWKRGPGGRGRLKGEVENELAHVGEMGAKTICYATDSSQIPAQTTLKTI